MINASLRFLVAAWLAVGMLLSGPAAAQELLPVPNLVGHVLDPSGTLTAEEKMALEAKLTAFEQAKGSQVVILMVPSTAPEDIASYANRIANAWKIGRKEVGDGLLLLVAKEDRRVRIEVAKSLEGAIPDLAASNIIEQAITPSFRAGNYAGGLNAGVDQIIARINGEELPMPANPGAGSSRGGDGFEWMDLAIFFLFAVPIGASVARSVFGQKLGALFTGGGVGALALLVTSSLVIASIAAFIALLFALFSNFSSFSSGRGRRTGAWGAGGIGAGGFGAGGGWSGGGGGGFGGGGGGFSSGGGGDFGGGGASGSW